MGKLRIVFYGTPDFAVPSLEALIQDGCQIVGVVTVADKPAGRGQKVVASPVKEAAVRHGIPVLQPVNLKDENFVRELKSLSPDLQIVVAFRMMPEKVWKLPSKGTFNLHASLLPHYRGAAPINWAIINGEKETGVTTFFLRHEIDTGQILFREKTPIGEKETAGELHDRLMNIGAQLVVKTVHAIESGDYNLTEQEDIVKGTPLKTAPKLTKQDCRLNIHSTVQEAANLVRGLSPYPAAFTDFYNDNGLSIIVKLFDTTPVETIHSQKVAAIETDQKSFLKIYFKNGYLLVNELQVAGRSRMPIREFLNGFRVAGNWEIH